MPEESTERRPPRPSRGRRPDRAERPERGRAQSGGGRGARGREEQRAGAEEAELPGRPVTFRYPPPEGAGGDGPAVELLCGGELTVEGRLVAASNATLYCTVELDGQTAACVYKPVAGERPLWDFPGGTLAGREVAAYAVSQAAGWNLVPPTVMRDGPYGPGMCQLWIDADPGTDLVALARSRDQPKLRDMAVFDAVVNNADRKIGHLLPVGDGRLYGCDHGVCFGEEYKLRTVLWQWRGQKLPGRALAALARLNTELASGSLAERLPTLLSEDEVTATRERIELLIEHKVHPYPPENWPAVPWPPV
jgi:uncharacterized repeat protein (TIGR03843 family)